MVEIHLVNRPYLDKITKRLLSQGFTCFQMEVGQIADEKTFFRESTQSLPMGDADVNSDLGWRTPTNWQAFGDFLYQGFLQIDSPKIAIVLDDVDAIESSNRTFIQNAIDFVQNAADAVNASRPLQVALIITSKGNARL